jgi:MtN3 and saliva related transmembrane protein
MITPDIIASLAAFFTMIGYVPQAIKTIKTRDTSGISFWMYLFTIIGVIFWLIFGIMIMNVPMIFKNITVIIFGGIVLYIKSANILKSAEDKNSFVRYLKKFFKK